MNLQPTLEKCAPFISSQVQGTGLLPVSSTNGSTNLAVTISRQTGSGAHSVAQKLAEYLQAHRPGQRQPWTVFDRNLVETALEQHQLPQRMARFIPEDRISQVAEVVDELLGIHPPSATLLRRIHETILRLAQQGNVILIGRGANIITRGLDYVLHVRLVGSLPNRIAHIQHIRSIDRQQALELVRKEDRARWRYLKQHFDRDLDDPLLYHLTINTDFVSYDNAARIIGDAALNRLHRSPVNH